MKRRRDRTTVLVTVTAAALTALGLAGCAVPERRPREPQPGEPTLRVLSYNVNYGLAGDGSTVAAIRAADADLVVLQETTPAWEAVVRRELGAHYPHVDFLHAPGAGGLAVLSRTPFRTEAVSPPPEGGWFPAWRVRLPETPIGPVRVIGVHLRPPISDGGSVVSGYLSTPAVREREIARHAEGLAQGEVPTLVVGDFNESDGDAVRWLRERGFRSVLPEFHPGLRTWRWQTSLGEITATLDHIAYDRRLVPLDARVIEAGRSDHLPIVATFARAPRPR